jgi:integrase-like protein
LRDECLNEYVFSSLGEARAIIEVWRHDYNHLRPHSSLGYLAPEEFAARNQGSSAIMRTAWPAKQMLAAQCNARRPRIQNLTVFRPPSESEGQPEKLGWTWDHNH